MRSDWGVSGTKEFLLKKKWRGAEFSGSNHLRGTEKSKVRHDEAYAVRIAGSSSTSTLEARGKSQ